MSRLQPDPDHRAGRGRLGLRPARQALPRRPVRTVHQPDRPRSDRAGRGRRPAGRHAGLLPHVELRPSRWPSSWPTGWPSSPRATATGSSSPPAGPRRWSRRGSWPASTSGVIGQPDRNKVISRNIAYHGATMGALSITGVTEIKTPFEPLVPGAVKVPNTNFYRAPYFADDLEAFGRWAADAIEQAILIEGPDTVAAVFLEPVQNAGGCFPPPPGYFQRVREICDRYGVLLVSDEVICAFGRLGHWFGAERYDYRAGHHHHGQGTDQRVLPARGHGGQRPAGRAVPRPARASSTASPSAGHPVSAAVALANIDVFEKEGLLENVREQRGRVQGVPRHPPRPAHRGRRPGRGLLLRDRAGQGQGHPRDLRRRRGRAPARGASCPAPSTRPD